jgi:hypothetical protein
MPSNRDKISAFCRKYPQIADVFPNKTHFLFLVKYRKMKIVEKKFDVSAFIAYFFPCHETTTHYESIRLNHARN